MSPGPKQIHELEALRETKATADDAMDDAQLALKRLRRRKSANKARRGIPRALRGNASHI